MKFKFSLQKVLEHRKTLEDLTQRDFQVVQSEFMKQQAILVRLHEELQEARMEAGRVQEDPVESRPERLKQIHEFTVLQDIRIEKQKAKVLEHEKLVEEKREILREKAVDFKMMERLKEKKHEEFKFELKQQEQKELDELSILRFDLKDAK